MASNVTVQVTGGSPKVVSANTIREAMNAIALTGNYSAMVNGNPASLDDSITDYSFVTLSPAIKGGL